MEENNDIFRTGGDALVYLAGQKISTSFVSGHPLSAYVSIFQPLPPL